jgi:non-structural maintenance of chromosomes element 1
MQGHHYSGMTVLDPLKRKVLTQSKGQRCKQRDCPCRLHDICAQNFFRSQRSQTCPICQAAWYGKDFVGEKAITMSESYLKGKRRSGGSRRVEEAEANEEENGDGG